MKWLLTCLIVVAFGASAYANKPVVFTARTAKDGQWSNPQTWEQQRLPKAGDYVQIRAVHSVVYDVNSPVVLRMLHVAGNLRFTRDHTTRLEVGLIKIEPGETTTEDGFDCHASSPTLPEGTNHPTLEIGTAAAPIPANVRATIRLHHFKDANADSLPAIIVCGGRWDVHGAPLQRTWLRLAASAKAGDSEVTLENSVNDWRSGDRIIITSSEPHGGPEAGHTFEKRANRRQKQRPVGTEERLIRFINGARVTLDRPLEKNHQNDESLRCVVANLSRNVVIESATPQGVRGHTMYHHGSTGGISYAEFRHLGKEGLLGKYAIHFHLVRDTMRGSGVLGASIWDSHNRWLTVHGTDYLLIRDCVGYQSRGHGYFLEDATEQWNIFDRNLAVQAFGATPLPGQVLPYDPNDGAGFWWANGRNTFIRNVTCENDHYGYHFHLEKTAAFDPLLRLSDPDGKVVRIDVRTIPFLRFEENESHGDGLFAFRFGDATHASVRGDRRHPFVARHLRVWHAHYALRPNISNFLLDGLHVQDAAFGVYHPNYDAHVYRDITLAQITREPLNGGHDESSLPTGDFTFERLTLKNCRLESDPLIQLTLRAEKPGLVGHFHGVTLDNSHATNGVVAFGGGPRTNKNDNPICYYFHDTPMRGKVTRVVHGNAPRETPAANAQSIDGWTGRDARALVAPAVTFPQLLDPLDDLPPASLLTHITVDGKQHVIRGVSHDNGRIATVVVNGKPATIIRQHAGVADWSITLDAPADGRYHVTATDEARNTERTPHILRR